MKKTIALILVGLMALSLMACGSTKTEIANPWKSITEEEAAGMVTNGFSAPEGATNVKWSVMDSGKEGIPGSLVQMTFDLDGNSFTARQQTTGDNYEDISGMHYTWTVEDDVTLANWAGGAMQGKTYRYVGDNEYADLCTWYDVEIGESYSLSVTAKDLDGFDIQAVAEQLYDPAKQAWVE